MREEGKEGNGNEPRVRGEEKEGNVNEPSGTQEKKLEAKQDQETKGQNEPGQIIVATGKHLPVMPPPLRPTNKNTRGRKNVKSRSRSTDRRIESLSPAERRDHSTIDITKLKNIDI